MLMVRTFWLTYHRPARHHHHLLHRVHHLPARHRRHLPAHHRWVLHLQAHHHHHLPVHHRFSHLVSIQLSCIMRSARSNETILSALLSQQVLCAISNSMLQTMLSVLSVYVNTAWNDLWRCVFAVCKNSLFKQNYEGKLQCKMCVSTTSPSAFDASKKCYRSVSIKGGTACGVPLSLPFPVMLMAYYHTLVPLFIAQ